MVGSAAYLAPVDWAQAADGLLLNGVTEMQEGFLGQVGLGDRDTLPTVLVDQVVYRTGCAASSARRTSRRRKELGRDLLRAQTFTKAEVAEGRATPWSSPSRRRPSSPPSPTGWATATRTSQGEAGSRVGAGILAVVQAMCIALFQLLSKVLVLVAMLLLRLMVMTAPAVAVVAVLKPDILPALLRVAGAAIVNTLVVGALAGLHALLVVSLFRAGSGHRSLARAAGHRRGDGGAVGGGAPVPAARLDGLAHPRPVRRDRAGRRARGRCRGSGSACVGARSRTGSRGGGTSGATARVGYRDLDGGASGGRAGRAGPAPSRARDRRAAARRSRRPRHRCWFRRRGGRRCRPGRTGSAPAGGDAELGRSR